MLHWPRTTERRRQGQRWANAATFERAAKATSRHLTELGAPRRTTSGPRGVVEWDQLGEWLSAAYSLPFTRCCRTAKRLFCSPFSRDSEHSFSRPTDGGSWFEILGNGEARRRKGARTSAWGMEDGRHGTLYVKDCGFLFQISGEMS
jgi:hypothetical protein